jgi:hypothetical protein
MVSTKNLPFNLPASLPHGTKRLRFISLALFLFITPFQLFSQARHPPATTNDHVNIGARTLVIIRRGALVKDFPEKRRATVTYPVVSGLTDPRILRRVQAILDVKNIFETSIAEYREDNWLEEFGYEVGYNRNYILDITFSQSGAGAYPDTQSRHFAINLKTGNAIKASDVFVESKRSILADLVNRRLQAELKRILEELSSSKSDPEDIRIAKEAQEPLEFKIENLNDFAVGPKGITFLYDAGYPHVIQAFEPVGRYFFMYAELKPFIKRESVLGQFIE